MDLIDSLHHFLFREADVRAGDGLVVAFSGGTDSTALLWGLSRLAAEHDLSLVAAHLDHGLDAGSAGRARAAEKLADRLHVPFEGARRPPGEGRTAALGVEAAAREIRYGFLEEVRRRFAYRYVLTAHHRNDQAETVLLRILYGSGPLGLGGVQPRQGNVLRPLLAWSRAQLAGVLVEAGIEGIEDPTNHELSRPRNRLRRLLRAGNLQAGGRHAGGDLIQRLSGLAERARRSSGVMDRRCEERLRPRPEFDGVSVALDSMQELPSPLLAWAAGYLHRRAGLPYPSSRGSVAELKRQLEMGGRIGCDCGPDVRWERQGDRLHLRCVKAEPALFTYTLKLPGELEVREVPLRFQMLPSPVRPWMFRAHPRRAALALPSEPGERITIRNRRPGDRIRPFGWTRSCRLKDLLINRKIPRGRRDRLPLVCYGDTIAWVPGVTIDDRYRITSQRQVWVAEVTQIADNHRFRSVR